MKSSILVLLLLGLAPSPVTRLDVAHQPFLDDFRAAEGSVRFIAVLSPT
jgi:hypothetical protein